MEFLAISTVAFLTAFLTDADLLLQLEIVVGVFLLRAVLRVLQRTAAVRAVKIPEANFTLDPHPHFLDALDDLSILLFGVEDNQIPPTGL